MLNSASVAIGRKVLCGTIKGHRIFSTVAFPSPTVVLFLSSLLPEPNASAAGIRTEFFLRSLARCSGVESIHYGTGAKRKTTDRNNAETQQELRDLGVQFHEVPFNGSDAMSNFLKCTENQRSVLVVVDRFYAEEAYSFHIHGKCPNATIVLDMQDMHSLRFGRQTIVEGKKEQSDDDPFSDLPIGYYPSSEDEMLKRELASIHRSDLALVCSPWELHLLKNVYNIPESKLCLAPFFIDPSSIVDPFSFDERKDFVFVGGFRHAPNVDAVRTLKTLWPRLRQALVSAHPDIKLHIYGPFCPHKLYKECHDPSSGFLMHGFHPSLDEILSTRRVLLAPIRFGAGIKGKIVEAWKFGLPVVTTSMGSEGMQIENGCEKWGGVVANSMDDFVEGAASLYCNASKWHDATNKSKGLLKELYGIHHWDSVASQLQNAMIRQEQRRESDYTRSVLWHQTLRSTEYFSRWIESRKTKQDGD